MQLCISYLAKRRFIHTIISVRTAKFLQMDKKFKEEVSYKFIINMQKGLNWSDY